MKNIRITFRLSPYQLARGLQIIRQLEPTYKLISLNDVVKVIYHDYLAKMTINKLEEIPSSIIAEVMAFIEQPAEKQITLNELIALKKSAKSLPEPPPEPPKTMGYKPAKFDDPNKTSSDISSVTDFSPPKDWKES